MAGNYDLGTARGTIELVSKGDGAQKAQKDLDQLTSSTSKTNQALSDVGGTAQKAGAAIGAGIAVAVKSAADFESKMSAVKAVSGATAGEMQQLTDKALQLGKETKFSASEAASAIEELVKAGISVPDVMNGAADATVALAAAGEIDLARAAEISANAMNQFKLEAGDLPHVADLLAGAANASAVSVDDLGEALNYVGPVAQSMGVSIDDTAAALAILGNNGIKGSAAGTALRGTLLGLTPTTEKQRKEFEKLGLITKDGANIFYDAQGNMKPLGDVMQILNDKTKNLSKEEKAAFYEGAFGRNAMTAATILGGETAASFDKMSESIGKVKAADVAAARLDNFKGTLEELKGSIETLMIVAGTPLLKTLNDIAQALTKFANIILALPPGVVEFGTKLAALSAGILLIGGTIMKVIVFISKFKEAFIALGIAQKLGPIFVALRAGIAALAGPVGIVIAVITTLVAIFVKLYKENPKFKAFVDGIVAAVKNFFIKAFDQAQRAVHAFFEVLKGQGTTGSGGIVGFFEKVALAVKPFVDALKELWAVWQTTIWPILKDAASQVWQALKQAWVDMKPALSELWAALKELWTALEPLRKPITDLIVLVAKIVAGFLLWSAKMNLETIVTLIKLGTTIATVVLPPLIEFVTWVITKVIPAITEFIVKVVEIITKLVEFGTKVVESFEKAKVKIEETVGIIVAKIQEIINKITTFVTETKLKWDQFWDGLKLKATEIWTAIKDAVTNGINLVKTEITTRVQEIRDSWTQRWDEIKLKATEIWEGIKQAVQTGIGAVKLIIDTVVGQIKTAWESFWNLFGPPVTAAWGLIKSIVELGIAAVKLVIVTVTTEIKQAWEQVWTAIKNFIGPIWAQIKTAISGAATAVKTELQTRWTEIKNSAITHWNEVKAKATEIWTAIKTAIVGQAGGTPGPVGAAWNQVKSTTESVFNSIKTFTSTTWTAIKDAISTAANAVKGVVAPAWESVKSTTTTAWNAVKTSTTQVWNSLKQVITTAINAAKAAVTPAVNAIKTAVDQAWTAVKTATKTAWDSLSGTIKAGIDKALTVVKSLKDQVVNAVKDAGTWLLAAGKAVVQGFIDGITSKIHEAEAKIRELTDKVKAATTAKQGLDAKSPSRVFFQYGTFTVQGYIDGVDSLMGRARTKLNEFMEIVKRAAQEKLKLGSPSKIFFEYGEWSVKGYIEGMERWLPEIDRIMNSMTAMWPQVADQVKRSMTQISGHLRGVNFQGKVQDIMRQLAPLTKNMAITRGNGFATASIGGRPVAQVNIRQPATPPVGLPDRVTLKVGDREFTAYVDERADALLGQAASLLARGRK